MSEPSAYRADNELSAALREYAERAVQFGREVIRPFDLAHRGNEVLWARSPFSADEHAMGFNDEAGVPDGLSKAKTRRELRPSRGEAGKPWREVLAEMDKRPQVERVWHRFGLSPYGRGRADRQGREWVAPVLFHDCGDDGVIVYCTHPVEARSGDPAVSTHLTPIPLSEFYSIKERIQAERQAERAS